MTHASLDTSGTRPAVKLERHLPDPPAVVWQAITDRAQLKAWFPCDVIVEGGRWAAGARRGDDRGVHEGRAYFPCGCRFRPARPT